MKTGSKTRLFLIELVIIILFFAFAGAICANIFVKAHTLSSKSTDISMAVMQAQSAAECVKDTDGDAKKLCDLLDGQDTAEGLTVYYDKDWKPSDESGAKYELSIALTQENGFLNADISVLKGDEEIYSIETGKYLGK